MQYPKRDMKPSVDFKNDKFYLITGVYKACWSHTIPRLWNNAGEREDKGERGKRGERGERGFPSIHDLHSFN